MSVRRLAAFTAVVAAVAMLALAALTPLRADEIASLDAEADRIGREWTKDQGNQALIAESNAFFDEARDLEAPLAPPVALGGAMLAAAAAVALWPSSRERSARDETSVSR